MHRIIYSKSTTAEGQDAYKLLARSSDITPATADQWQMVASVTPLAPYVGEASQAIGIFELPSRDFLLARAQQNGKENLYEALRLPNDFLRELAGHLAPLITLCRAPIPSVNVPDTTLDAVEVPTVGANTYEQSLMLVEALLTRYAGDMLAVLSLLGAALHKRGLHLTGFPTRWEERAEIACALMQLLPRYACAEMTFATHTQPPLLTAPRIVFADALVTSERWVGDAARELLPGEAALHHPYVSHLVELWTGDLHSFMRQVRAMDVYARPLMSEKSLDEGLRNVLDRQLTDAHIASGGKIAPDKLLRILHGDAPPTADLRFDYAKHLLHHALDERTAETRRAVTTWMDKDAEVDAQLAQMLIAELENRPEEVYALIRNRMADGAFDARWLERLHSAAAAALHVAIADSDAETLLNWLRLIAREPLAYELTSTLTDALTAALPRAEKDAELGQQMLILAVRRSQALIPQLLERAALPEIAEHALRDHQEWAINSIENVSRELFLLSASQVIAKRDSMLVTSSFIERLWTLAHLEQPLNLPEVYQPEHLIDVLLETGAAWLSDTAAEQLVFLLLARETDAALYQFAGVLAAQDRLVKLLPTALQNSARSATDILDIVGQIKGAGHLSQQEAIDIYGKVLIGWEWRKTALPVMEQITRMIQNNPKLDITRELLWRLLDVAAEFKAEQVARVTARRLFNELEKLDNDEQLVDTLDKLYEHSHWNVANRQALIGWWRAFVRAQPLTRLGRLDKLLEGKRTLQEAQDIVQTVVGIRKLFGGRDIETFAREVATAYDVMQAFAEAFEPSAKEPLHFEQLTVREELDQHDALAVHERNILANNLKELASLIAEMGDSRTKGGIVRRGVDLNRQLMNGEQQPQSAVDVMKWLAGYLNGAQDKGDTDHEH